MSVAQWIKVCEPDEIGADSVRMVKADSQIIALVRTGAGFGALANACPHMQGPLGQGHVEDGRLVCPWHGRAFDPLTGQCEGYAEAVRAFPVEERADGIYVNIADPVR